MDTWSLDGQVVVGRNVRGSRNNLLSEPFAVVVDRMGSVYVAEWG